MIQGGRAKKIIKPGSSSIVTKDEKGSVSIKIFDPIAYVLNNASCLLDRGFQPS